MLTENVEHGLRRLLVVDSWNVGCDAELVLVDEIVSAISYDYDFI